MYPRIVCECGRSLGDLYDAFKAMRLKQYIEVYKTLPTKLDPVKVAFSRDINMNMSGIFDALGLHLVCCRGKMTSQVEFKDIYD